MKVFNKINIGSINIQVNIMNEGEYSNTQTTAPKSDNIETENVSDIGTTEQGNYQSELNVSFEETLTLLTINLVENKENYERIYHAINGGKIGVVFALRSWAREFEQKFLGVAWGESKDSNGNPLDWYDEIDKFLFTKIVSYRVVYPETSDTDIVY